jgi:hypothetical protein
VKDGKNRIVIVKIKRNDPDSSLIWNWQLHPQCNIDFLEILNMQLGQMRQPFAELKKSIVFAQFFVVCEHYVDG